MILELPTDQDTNMFFEDVVLKLKDELGYSQEEAYELTREYYLNFTNEMFCKNIGVPVQEDDFFFHEGVGGVALRIHYYLKLKNDPSPRKFVDWRAKRRSDS